MTIYLLDSNFFIQAHRATYPLDVVISFWGKVKQLSHEGKIISIDKVQTEIYSNEDALKTWCESELPADFFKDTSNMTTKYARVASWANSRASHYKPSAIQEFLAADEADAWLVAYALDEGITVVTHEKSDPNSKKKIKIPDVCIEFNISYLDTIGMFRSLGESF